MNIAVVSVGQIAKLVPGRDLIEVKSLKGLNNLCLSKGSPLLSDQTFVLMCSENPTAEGFGGRCGAAGASVIRLSVWFIGPLLIQVLCICPLSVHDL